MISEAESAPAAEARAGARRAVAARRKVVVGTSVPNPNGDMHLGHLAGPFLSADVYARYRRMQGDEVYLQSGTDDFQTWTATMAAREGSTPAATAAKYADMIEASLKAARVEPDFFLRPSASAHAYTIAQDIMRVLHERGFLVAREVASPFCEPCGRLLFEGYVEGNCPHCGNWTYGSGCEGCARPLDSPQLANPRCKICGTTTTARRPLTRLYFPLKPHRERLLSYYETLVTNPYQRSVWQKLLDDDLPDMVASQPLDWGVPVALPGFEGHVVAPYLQMVADHLAASQTIAERIGSPEGWKRLWHGGDAAAAQFSGADNGWVFGVFYVAVFLAYDPELRPPVAYYPTQFYRLEDSVFSTSRRHAIWVREFVEKTSPDVVRFHCAHTSPEIEQTTFRLREFVDLVTHELGGAWGGWLARVFARAARDHGGAAPAPGAWEPEQARFHRRLARLVEEAAIAYETETFSTQHATRAAIELVRSARRFSRGEDFRVPGSAGEAKDTGMALELAAARALALTTAPLMPDFSTRLWQALGYRGSPEKHGWEPEPGFLPAGQRLAPPEGPFFPDVRHLLE